jgi:hypothetical protein
MWPRYCRPVLRKPLRAESGSGAATPPSARRVDGDLRALPHEDREGSVAPRLAAVVRDRMRRGALAAADRLAAEVSLLPGGAADLPPVAPPTSSLRMVDVVER